MIERNSSGSVYLIGVVAEVLEMHPQTLRKYEQEGFIEPSRTGTLRLYSQEDIDRLRVIKHFVEDLGLNLAGVQLALTITARLLKLRAELGTIKEPSPMDTGTVGQIDKILEDLRLRVIHEATPEGTKKALPEPQMKSVEFHRGEKLEFLRSTQ